MKVIEIAFDLDGTLINIMDPVERLLMEKYGAKIIHPDGFQLHTEPFLEDDLIWDCIIEAYDYHDEIKIYPGAKEIITQLYNASDNDPVKIITARPLKRSANTTYKFISERLCDLPYELVLVSDNDKLPYLNRYTYFVEDRRKTAITLADAGKIVFLLRRPWNALPAPHKNIIMIDKLEDLLPYVGFFINYHFELPEIHTVESYRHLNKEE